MQQMHIEKPVEIYMRLIGLHHEQWRVAEAVPMGEDLYKVIGPIPDGEQWEFQPGQIVSVEEFVLTLGGYGLLAVSCSKTSI